MDSWEGSQLNTAKEILAYELTKLVHGEAEAEKAQNAAKALFVSGGASADMPATEVTDADLKDGAIQVADLLVLGGMCPSKGEAKRLIQQGGVLLDDVKVERFDASVTAEQLKGDGVVLKKGKKTYRRFYAN